MIFLSDLKKHIEKKISNTNLAKVLLSKFKIGFEQPGLLTDSTYLPFYYYLGEYLKDTKNLFEFGFDLGMPSGCFIEGCKNIENFAAFRKKTDKYYAKRLGIANIHNILKKRFDLWTGNETDPELFKLVFSHKWDVVIINEGNKSCLDLIWSQVEYDGLIIYDFLPSKEFLESFCKLQNKEPIYIKTSRLTGIVQK